MSDEQHQKSSWGMSAEEMLREIYDRVVGDGTDANPGLDKRVDRLEQRGKVWAWVSGTALGAVIAYSTNWVVAKFQGKP